MCSPRAAATPAGARTASAGRWMVAGVDRGTLARADHAGVDADRDRAGVGRCLGVRRSRSRRRALSAGAGWPVSAANRSLFCRRTLARGRCQESAASPAVAGMSGLSCQSLTVLSPIPRCAANSCLLIRSADCSAHASRPVQPVDHLHWLPPPLLSIPPPAVLASVARNSPKRTNGRACPRNAAFAHCPDRLARKPAGHARRWPVKRYAPPGIAIRIATALKPHCFRTGTALLPHWSRMRIPGGIEVMEITTAGKAGHRPFRRNAKEVMPDDLRRFHRTRRAYQRTPRTWRITWNPTRKSRPPIYSAVYTFPPDGDWPANVRRNRRHRRTARRDRPRDRRRPLRRRPVLRPGRIPRRRHPAAATTTSEASKRHVPDYRPGRRGVLAVSAAVILAVLIIGIHRGDRRHLASAPRSNSDAFARRLLLGVRYPAPPTGIRPRNRRRRWPSE